MEIKYGLPQNIHMASQPYNRSDLVEYAIYLDTTIQSLNAIERSQLEFIFKDNNELLVKSWPVTTLGGKRSFDMPMDERLKNSPYWRQSKKTSGLRTQFQR